MRAFVTLGLFVFVFGLTPIDGWRGLLSIRYKEACILYDFHYIVFTAVVLRQKNKNSTAVHLKVISSIHDSVLQRRQREE